LEIEPKHGLKKNPFSSTTKENNKYIHNHTKHPPNRHTQDKTLKVADNPKKRPTHLPDSFVTFQTLSNCSTSDKLENFTLYTHGRYKKNFFTYTDLDYP